MSPFSRAVLLALSMSLFPIWAMANEAQFLQKLEGNWRGNGEVRLKPESAAINVSCTLASDASGDAVRMDGQCTGLLVLSRPLTASLRASGERYSGSYTGAARGPADLSGNRSGQTLNLKVQWPNQSADMQLASTGDGHMKIVTIEPHPATGKPIVTAQINLTRE